MTIAEMAAKYRVTESCVRNWISLQKVRATKTDCGWVIPDDQRRPEAMPPQNRWQAHKRPMGRPTTPRKVPPHLLSDHEKQEILWRNFLSSKERSMKYFERLFRCSADEIRDLYDAALREHGNVKE